MFQLTLNSNCENYFFSQYTAGTDIVMQDTYMIGNNVTFSSQWGCVTILTSDRAALNSQHLRTERFAPQSTGAAGVTTARANSKTLPRVWMNSPNG